MKIEKCNNYDTRKFKDIVSHLPHLKILFKTRKNISSINSAS